MVGYPVRRTAPEPLSPAGNRAPGGRPRRHRQCRRSADGPPPHLPVGQTRRPFPEAPQRGRRGQDLPPETREEGGLRRVASAPDFRSLQDFGSLAGESGSESTAAPAAGRADAGRPDPGSRPRSLRGAGPPCPKEAAAADDGGSRLRHRRVAAGRRAGGPRTQPRGRGAGRRRSRGGERPKRQGPRGGRSGPRCNAGAPLDGSQAAAPHRSRQARWPLGPRPLRSRPKGKATGRSPAGGRDQAAAGAPAQTLAET